MEKTAYGAPKALKEPRDSPNRLLSSLTKMLLSPKLLAALGKAVTADMCILAKIVSR